MAYYAGETITDTISHIVGGSPITGATFTVVTATKPDGTTFTPTITEVGGGSYTVSFSTANGEDGNWYLLVVDSAQDPDVYYEETYDVDPQSATRAGTTLARLRRDVAEQIGDVLIGTATATGTLSTFTDAVTFVQGANTLAGRQAVMTTGHASNVGVIRAVTGNDPTTGTITVRPDFAIAPAISDVIELYSARSGGPLIPELNRAINRAIRDAAYDNLIEVTSIPADFDDTAPTYTIPAGWYGILHDGAEWLDDDDVWQRVSYRELDRYARTLAVGQSRGGRGWLTGKSVRLRGYTVPSELTSDSDTTAINPEWLVNRASYHALMATAKKQTPSEANLTLGMAQAFREEASRTQSLARPRLRAFHLLGV